MSAPSFRFSVNRQGRNKQWDYKLLTTKFEDREGTILDLIEAVRAGYAVNGAWFGGKSRSKANVLGVGCLLLDFDNSKAKLDSNGLPLKDSQGKIISEYDPQLTKDAALTHPFLSRYAAAIYTSPSHKPTWHKLRAVIPLPRFLPADDYESVAQLVLEEFPMADPACSDAGRVFFGHTNTEVYFLGGEPLPPDWIKRARQKTAQRKAEQERIRQERLKWLETQNTDSTKELALEALKSIPPRQPGTGTYYESLTVLMALVDLFGPAEAESIAETWSPSDRKAGWIIPQKIRSFKRNGVTVGSLFHIAQQYGWKFPERPSRTSHKHNQEEPDPQAYAEYIAREKEEEQVAEAIEKESFLDWLKRKILKLSPHFKKGFAQYQPVQLYLPKKLIWSGKSPLPTPKEYAGFHLKIIFPKGKRTQLRTKLFAQGWSLIQDVSFTGSGKTHDAGLASNDQGKLFYFDIHHNNPSVSTISENFDNLFPRHDGMFSDSDGKLKVARTPEQKEQAVIKANCWQADTFFSLKAKGYSLENSPDHPCHFCPYKGVCGQESKPGLYGYKFERSQTLKQLKINAHLDSSPDPNSTENPYNYSQDTALIEEASTQIRGTKTIAGNLLDFYKTFNLIESNLPEHYQTLWSLKQTLLQLFDGIRKEVIDFLADGDAKVKNNIKQYGLNHEQLIKLLPTIPDNLEGIIEAIESLLLSQVGSSFVEPDSVTGLGGKWRAAGETARAYFRREARQETLENIKNLPTTFLVHFLKVWSGLANGSLRFTNGKLQVTIKDSRHADVINKLASATFLDATAQKEVEAAKLGIDPTSIVEIEEERPPIDNLTIFNINLPGMKSGNYSASCKQKQQKLLQTILSAQGYEIDFPEEISSEQLESLGVTALKVLASKKDQHLPKDGYWHHHSRATNEFKGVEILVVFGTPNPNVGAVQDEYRALFGSLEGFEAYYQHLVRSEIIQLVGRQRPHLYPEQQFYIYMVGTDQDLSNLDEQFGITVINKQSFEFCPEAGTDKQASKWKVWNSVQHLLRCGLKITAAAVAAQTGLCERWVRKVFGNWREFKKAVLSLYNTPIGRVPVNEAQLHHQDLLKHNNLRLMFELDPLKTASEVVLEIHDYGWQKFREALSLKPLDIQILLLGSIAPLFLPEIDEVVEAFVKQRGFKSG